MLAKNVIDPEYPGTPAIAWPIPHMCPHKRPCHGPTLTPLPHWVPGGSCRACLESLP